MGPVFRQLPFSQTIRVRPSAVPSRVVFACRETRTCPSVAQASCFFPALCLCFVGGVSGLSFFCAVVCLSCDECILSPVPPQRSALRSGGGGGGRGGPAQEAGGRYDGKLSDKFPAVDEPSRGRVRLSRAYYCDFLFRAVPGWVRNLLTRLTDDLVGLRSRRLMERFFPSFGELAPALDGIGPLDQQYDDAADDDDVNTSIWNFAVPKKKVSHSIRRLRQTHKWMQPDPSVYQCPVCKAFKKRHIAMHCARAEDICGLGECCLCSCQPAPPGRRWVHVQ